MQLRIPVRGPFGDLSGRVLRGVEEERMCWLGAWRSCRLQRKVQTQRYITAARATSVQCSALRTAHRALVSHDRSETRGCAMPPPGAERNFLVRLHRSARRRPEHSRWERLSTECGSYFDMLRRKAPQRRRASGGSRQRSPQVTLERWGRRATPRDGGPAAPGPLLALVDWLATPRRGAAQPRPACSERKTSACR